MPVRESFCMKILALSDIHGAVDNVRSILAREEDYDLVLVAGDITDIGLDDYTGTAREIVELLGAEAGFVKAVPGNMDNESVLELLIGNRVNLHRDLFSMGEYEFVGFGGSTKSEISLDRANASSSPSGQTAPGVETPFEPADEERGAVLEQLLERTKAGNRAVVSHAPPHGTAADHTSSGDHVGSASLRKLIADEDIEFVLCGHIHESRTVDEVDGTVVVNPGPVKDGMYAVMEIGDGIGVELRGG